MGRSGSGRPGHTQATFRFRTNRRARGAGPRRQNKRHQNACSTKPTQRKAPKDHNTRVVFLGKNQDATRAEEPAGRLPLVELGMQLDADQVGNLELFQARSRQGPVQPAQQGIVHQEPAVRVELATRQPRLQKSVQDVMRQGRVLSNRSSNGGGVRRNGHMCGLGHSPGKADGALRTEDSKTEVASRDHVELEQVGRGRDVCEVLDRQDVLGDQPILEGFGNLARGEDQLEIDRERHCESGQAAEEGVGGR